MSFIQTDPYSKVNTNRLLCETETLNSKVNQYRQALSLGFPSGRNDSINMSMYTTGLGEKNSGQMFAFIELLG